jgi:excisionase family DNA binding protein
VRKVPEVAKALGISTQSTWKLIYAGRLPFVRIGRSIRLTDEDVAAFIKANRTSRSTKKTTRVVR